MVNRILVIDDVQADCFRVASILRNNVSGAPYDVTECNTSKDAFKQLAQGGPYQAVVCDYILPDCDGVTLLRITQKALGDATPPFLFVTSHAPHMEEEARAAGASDVLAKPIRPRKLLEAISALIRHAQSERRESA